MKKILLLVALVLVFVVLLATPDLSDAKKKKKTPTPIPQGQQVNTMPYSIVFYRTVATIPNFTPAAGDYIVPNSDTVSTNFVLEGDTGGGSWVTIPVTEYQLFPKSGKIAMRPTDEADGADVDWGIYSAFQIATYMTSVSGTRTTYTDEAVTFADEADGYSPIGVVGEINGEAIKDIIVNILVAAGASIVIDDNGINVEDNILLDEDGIQIVDGSSSVNQIKFVEELGGQLDASIFNIKTALLSQLFLWSNSGSDATNGELALIAESSGGSPQVEFTIGTLAASSNSYARIRPNFGSLKGFLVAGTGSDTVPVLSDGNGIDVNGKLLRLRLSKTPASAGATGNTGEIAWDSNYIYVCVATNTWKRVALSTW